MCTRQVCFAATALATGLVVLPLLAGVYVLTASVASL
jgi:hypothetical protein